MSKVRKKEDEKEMTHLRRGKRKERRVSKGRRLRRRRLIAEGGGQG